MRSSPTWAAEDHQGDGVGEGAALGLLVSEAGFLLAEDVQGTEDRPCQRSGSACTDR